MTFKHAVVGYLIAALVFLVLDAIWLSTMAQRLYRPAIGHLMGDTVQWVPAVLFYLLYLVGILFFAVAPAQDGGSALGAIGRGALFGLLAYATYDLTNQATLRDWPWSVTLADLAWGAFVTAAAAGASAAVVLRLDRG
ncbi:DUF2177 family protein [Aquabacterium sp. J223]|uniref:DUF2177 family protein n=1 Tax=Aquabacterium sp. J223 TaxID=2898431 RepID=UPI0021AD7856|nr:DUF2177 family protein [Aquabacterium sp. J223]UUX94401.1 DUF2177 family protein [Aquabacterium sp. J223]